MASLVTCHVSNLASSAHPYNHLYDRKKSVATSTGYLDDQWEEERLRFFTCGVFELHKHFHSNHGSMPAEDCLEALMHELLCRVSPTHDTLNLKVL